VRTSLGLVRDVGTRFEVRVADGSLRIRVRAGRVQLQRGTTVTPAIAETETVVNDTGVAVRDLPAYDPEWAWTTAVAPSFAIEGRSLAAFLQNTAAEHGWTLRFASKDVADAAARVVLHGSVDGLRPDEALGVAVGTSGLRYQLHDGDLLVSRVPDSR
jgi:ferric-dicitrate binding protein FerR (iron transport regulator)